MQVKRTCRSEPDLRPFVEGFPFHERKVPKIRYETFSNDGAGVTLRLSTLLETRKTNARKART